MKKVFIALVAVIMFNSCTTTPDPLAISVDKATFTQTNSNASTETLTSVITNTTSTSGSISWNFSEATAVTGWTYTISIDNTVQTGTSGSFDLGGSATATIVVNINPNNTTGVGQATLVLKNNDVVLNTLTYNHTTTSSAPAAKFTLSTNTASGASSATGPDAEYKTLLTNVSGAPLDIKWIRTFNSQNPPRWDYATCDIIQCHIPTITEYTFNIPKDSSFYFKTVFYTDNKTGSGDVSTLIFVPTDSLATVETFVATHTAN